MFNNKIAGCFDDLQQARDVLADLTGRRLQIPAASVTIGTCAPRRYRYTDQKYFLRLLSAWILIGALVGVGYAVQFLHLASAWSTAGAALAYAAVGAAAGQLVAGLCDIIFSGTLDDRDDTDAPATYIVDARVENGIKSEVKMTLQNDGAKSIVSSHL